MAFEIFTQLIIFLSISCAGYLTIASMSRNEAVFWAFIGLLIWMCGLSLPFIDKYIYFFAIVNPLGFYAGTLISICRVTVRGGRSG